MITQTRVDHERRVSAQPIRRDSMRPRHPALLVPLVLVFGFCYVLPLLNVVRLSLFDDSGLTLTYYSDLLGDPFVLRVIGRTLRVAALATVVSIVLGYPLGIILARSRGLARSLLTYAILAPLLLSGVVRSFGWFILIRPDGFVSNALAATGVLGNDDGLLFTEPAIVIGLVHLYMPMLTIAVSGSVQQVDARLLSAARSLGAPPATVFGRILLPLTMPGLVAGALLVFSLSSSAFATPAILGGSTVPVASYLIYQQGLLLGHWAAAGALAMLLLLVVAAISLLSVIVGRKYARTG
ncbi:MAG: ABC transporter permease [Nocardioidaceae bacterium]